MSLNFFSRLSSLSILALAAGSLTLTGCGLGSSVGTASTGPIALPAFEGAVMGGETAVANSQVMLWETGRTGYGAGASNLAGPVTSSSPGGNFSFTTGYSCANPNDYVYATATGGDASNGAGTAINKNLVMVAALGPCSSFSGATAQGSVRLVINELTTIAAAYALSGFTTVASAAGGATTFSSNQQVLIGAPANNAAALGACTGSGPSMTCTAAGMAHAFSNAANLVSASNLSGSGPMGQANTTVPNNPYGSVPQALINTLGNAMQNCVNSTGGVAGDSSNCGYFFANATPTVGAAPTDTLTAMINIAHEPNNNVGTTCTGLSGGTYCLATGLGAAFQPSLSGAPHDWSIGIAYTGVPTLPAAPVTAYSIASNVATFTANNSFSAGQTVLLSGFPTTTLLNNQTVSVLASGLSATSFQANVEASSNITAYNITGNIATFTSSNNFAVGENVVLGGFATSTFLTGQTVQITSATSLQFQATVTHADVVQTTEAGTATFNNTATESGKAAASFGSPQYVVLDANDNVYLETANTFTGTVDGLSAMNSAGGGLWSNVPSNVLCVSGAMAADANGYIWVSVPASTTAGCSYSVSGYNASTGALNANYVFYGGSGTICNTSTPTSANCPGYPAATTTPDTVHPTQSTPKTIALDRFSNLWYGRSSSTCTNCILELTYTAGSPGTYAKASTQVVEIRRLQTRAR